MNPLKLAVSLGLDYLRWTQLTPLLTVWAFALAMLAALILVNYQEQTFDAVATLTQWFAGLPWIGDKFTTWMNSQAGEDGSIHLGGNDLKAAALKVWGVLSLAFMVISLAVSWMFGPFKPWPLKRKFVTAALCCLALLLAYVAVSLANPEEFNGPLSSWILTFGGITLILFVVTAWCLSVAHLLDIAKRAVENSSHGKSLRGMASP